MYRNIEIVYVKITVSFFDISLYHKIVEIAIAKDQKYMILREKILYRFLGFIHTSPIYAVMPVPFFFLYR